MNYQPIIERTRAYLCLDCGKCTGSCPLARIDPDYSPRRIVERVVSGEAEALMADPRLWSCMTCGMCSTRCPSNVDFQRFIIDMRAAAFAAGERGTYTHGGILHEIMRTQTLGMHQDRTRWLTEDLQVSQQSDTLYFAGCLPFFDIIFADLDVEATEIARSAVRLLNRAGIVPNVSNDERCCGADLLLAGDVDSFRRLAELNVKAISQSGARRVVFTCAECYNAFKNDYPEYVGALPFEVTHLTELLAGCLDTVDLAFEPVPGLVTYHDPCRMARHLKVHEPPRQLIESVPQAQLVEMEDNRERAMCCGSTAWVNCGGCAKSIQYQKLAQARDTGARLMLTSCPKCQIHLRCASRDVDEEEKVRVEDVTSWLGRAIR